MFTLHYLLSQDATTEQALYEYFDNALPTLHQVQNLTDDQINDMEVSNNIKDRIRSLRLLVNRMVPEADKLDQIKAHCTCPLTLCIAENPIMTQCCGAIFDGNRLFSYLGAALDKTCPLCRTSMSSSFLLQCSQNNAISRITSIF